MNKARGRRTLLWGSVVIGGTTIATAADANMLVTVSGADFHAAYRLLDQYISTDLANNFTYYNAAGNGSWMPVIATLPHVWRSSTTGTYTVYFDGKGSRGGVGITCGIYIYDYNGNLMLNAFRDAPPTAGSWETSIMFAAETLPTWAYMYAWCNIPPNQDRQGGGLYGMALSG